MNPALHPARTFSSIYGPSFVFMARTSPHATRWQPPGEMVLDMMTATMLTILGDMPIVCAASVSTPDALNLLRDTGFQVPSEIHRYFDVADYIRLLQNLCQDGPKMVVQHVHPPSEMPPQRCWIAPSVLSYINNKANLENLVPKSNLPIRKIVSVDQIAGRSRSWSTPVVIKAVTDETTGGGIDVRICRNNSDIQKAAEYFKDCRYVVVEEYMNILRNLCLHYCVTANGGIDFLGFTEQVSDEQGIYHGNWLEAEAVCPTDAVEAGTSIVRAAYERGFYGILGMDVAVPEDGPCKVFDLNFRGNGSSPARLYSKSVYQHYRKPVIRLRRLTGKGNYRDMLNAAYRAMAQGILLPLGSCDPEAGPNFRERPLLTGMILGETRRNVLENERKLAFLGLDI
ncbi:MAG: hypothetical protein CVU55_08485 [Deltaproteobacteria bacterium HGW-Deltaproteobacteria-13]|jgi:hypothetical protein|nr:MAG: hypothetical protein CVU55_08485 [Deltaproteobacteria bacterium HGW-Deltaproteobacteria-13]